MIHHAHCLVLFYSLKPHLYLFKFSNPDYLEFLSRYTERAYFQILETFYRDTNFFCPMENHR